MSDDPNRIDDVDADDDGDDGDDVNRLPAATAIDVLEYVTRALTDSPDDVRVELDDNGGRIRLDVFVADGDMGRVIGRKGRTAHAIRAVVRAAAASDGESVDAIEFVD